MTYIDYPGSFRGGLIEDRIQGINDYLTKLATQINNNYATDSAEVVLEKALSYIEGNSVSAENAAYNGYVRDKSSFIDTFNKLKSLIVTTAEQVSAEESAPIVEEFSAKYEAVSKEFGTFVSETNTKISQNTADIALLSSTIDAIDKEGFAYTGYINAGWVDSDPRVWGIDVGCLADVYKYIDDEGEEQTIDNGAGYYIRITPTRLAFRKEGEKDDLAYIAEKQIYFPSANITTATISGGSISIGDNFNVTSKGVITAKSGTLGGWSLSNTQIYNEVTVNNGTWRTFLNSQPLSDGSFRRAFGVSNTIGDNTVYPFYVTHDGKLYCSDATLDGTIKAENITLRHNGNNCLSIDTINFINDFPVISTYGKFGGILFNISGENSFLIGKESIGCYKDFALIGKLLGIDSSANTYPLISLSSSNNIVVGSTEFQNSINLRAGSINLLADTKANNVTAEYFQITSSKYVTKFYEGTIKYPVGNFEISSAIFETNSPGFIFTVNNVKPFIIGATDAVFLTDVTIKENVLIDNDGFKLLSNGKYLYGTMVENDGDNQTSTLINLIGVTSGNNIRVGSSTFANSLTLRTGAGNVNLTTSTGKAFYNGEEIATKDLLFLKSDADKLYYSISSAVGIDADGVKLKSNGKYLYGTAVENGVSSSINLIGVTGSNNIQVGFSTFANSLTLRTGAGNINLTTSTGKAYYNNNEIATINRLFTRTDADGRYYTKTNANNTFLTQTSASDTYLTQTSASNTYLTQTSASNTYLQKGNIEHGFATFNAITDSSGYSIGSLSVTFPSGKTYSSAPAVLVLFPVATNNAIVVDGIFTVSGVNTTRYTVRYSLAGNVSTTYNLKYEYLIIGS